MPIPPTDLTQRPPRSVRVRLGGYVILPRMIDKCRATLAGTNGEYHYACPLDQRFLVFAGIDPEDFKVEVAKGLGDGELLEWIAGNATNKHTDAQIALWSTHAETRAPSDVESREFFNGIHKAAGPAREDIVSWADVLDLDDFVSYGGKA